MISKWGEGTGTPMQHCTDPNTPSYDPATCHDNTTLKLMWLCEHAWDRMTPWERKFCQEVYGTSPMTRRQHIQVSKINSKYITKTPDTL